MLEALASSHLFLAVYEVLCGGLTLLHVAGRESGMHKACDKPTVIGANESLWALLPLPRRCLINFLRVGLRDLGLLRSICVKSIDKREEGREARSCPL